MPLLNIVGITPTFNTFNAGFAFISSERTPDYEWALKVFFESVGDIPVKVLKDITYNLVYVDGL
jgi:hypothetical protein